jgi:hypothetical protein
MHDIAREILAYGQGPSQPLGGSILGHLDPVTQATFESGSGCLATLRKGIQPGKMVPYTYNNVDPGSWTGLAWMGMQPALIVHLKLAAGDPDDRPSRDDLLLCRAEEPSGGQAQRQMPVPGGTRQAGWKLPNAFSLAVAGRDGTSGRFMRLFSIGTVVVRCA